MEDIFPLTRMPTHPGEILREEYLNELGISQSDFAKKINVSFQTINLICNEKRGISTEMALKLSRVFNTSVNLWLNLQRKYDIYTVLSNEKKKQEIDSLEPVSP